MKLLKVSIGVQRYQVLFETIFGLIWVKKWALEAQEVFQADSTPTPFFGSTEKPTLIRIKKQKIFDFFLLYDILASAVHCGLPPWETLNVFDS